MLQVRKDLCLGCGLCAQNCPQRAISLPLGQAEIDPRRCNLCGLCQQICPQGAIVERIIISPQALKKEIQDMHRQTEAILAKLEKLKIKKGDVL